MGLKLLQGILIGVGGVLPGVSGGVLCVVFGIYKTVMEFLAEPFRRFKTHVPRLMPVGIGAVIGFMGVAKLLSFLLEAYPAPSTCVFIGLITGMLPTILNEAGKYGRNKASYVSLVLGMVGIFALLIRFKMLAIQITPAFGSYLFCGICLVLSVIVPGLSASTLLMPLGLYEPFVAGISSMDFHILIPIGIGAIVALLLFAKAVNTLLEKHYSVAFHAIAGVVIAATIMTIPFNSFALSLTSALINVFCICSGIVAACLLDKFNQKYL